MYAGRIVYYWYALSYIITKLTLPRDDRILSLHRDYFEKAAKNVSGESRGALKKSVASLAAYLCASTPTSTPLPAITARTRARLLEAGDALVRASAR